MSAQLERPLDAVGVWTRRRRADGARIARRWAQAAFVLLIAVVVAFALAAGIAVHRMYTLGNTRYLQQAGPIYAATQDVLVQMLNQETAVRGYVITAAPSTLTPYRAGKAAERLDLAQISALAATDPRIPAQLEQVRRDVASLDAFFARQIALVAQGPAGQKLAQQRVLGGKARFDHFRTLALALEVDAGAVVARAQHEQHRTYRRTLAFLIAAAVVAAAIVIALLVWIPSRLYRLYRSEEEARVAAEEGAEASRALAHVTDAVVLVDDGDTVRYWNPAAEELFGLRARVATGKQVDAVAPMLRRLTATVGPSAVAFPSGERWLAAAETRFDGGRVTVLRDLTGDHELERLRSEFVATAAHELRTPLAAIYGAVRTIRRSEPELPEGLGEQLLAMIETESERLRVVTEQLLVSAQLDRDTLQLRLEAVDLSALCRRVGTAAALIVPDGVTLEVSVPEEPVLVSADADRLHQAIGNLVDNAIKYSPGGGRIALRLHVADGRAVVDVTDEGIGIPASEHGRIFEKFYRLDPTMTRGVGGSGLGLYIIREVVGRMGGRISVRSEPGRGSTFSIALPLA